MHLKWRRFLKNHSLMWPIISQKIKMLIKKFWLKFLGYTETMLIKKVIMNKLLITIYGFLLFLKENKKKIFRNSYIQTTGFVEPSYIIR